jgi:peptide/nickel transport system permease protein
MSVAELEAREVSFEQSGGGGLWADAWLRLRRNPGAIAGFVILGCVVIIAIFAPLIATRPTAEPRPHQGGLLLGRLGASVRRRRARTRRVSRIYRARYSLLIGVVSVTVGFFFGASRCHAGFVGGATDSVIMRITDIWLTIPGFLMAIGIVALLGPGLTQIMIAIGIINVPIFARLLRGTVLAQRENDFVLAARAVGVPRRSILGSHILPNAMSPVIVAGTLAPATAIIDAAGLGFLGLGPQDPSTPEWGTMLTNTVRFLQTAPHLAIIPGLAIVVTAISINLIGDGLREAIDPKMRSR